MIDLESVYSIAILGDRHTGKTNLAFNLLRNYKGKRNIFLIGYPKPIDNFKTITTFQDLFRLSNAIVFIDELQNFLKVYDKKANVELMQLLSFCAHSNITIIFTTNNSHFITRGLESFVDCWLLTRVSDLNSLKHGSKPRRIIETIKHPKVNDWGLNLNNGEYIKFLLNAEVGENGLFNFPNENIGKDWKPENCERNSE